MSTPVFDLEPLPEHISPLAKDNESVADLLLYLTIKTMTIDQAVSEFDHMKKEFPGNEKKHGCDENDTDDDSLLTQGM